MEPLNPKRANTDPPSSSERKRLCIKLAFDEVQAGRRGVGRLLGRRLPRDLRPSFESSSVRRNHDVFVVGVEASALDEVEIIRGQGQRALSIKSFFPSDTRGVKTV